MAQDFLSQEEVDALLKGVTGDTDEPEAGESAGGGVAPMWMRPGAGVAAALDGPERKAIAGPPGGVAAPAAPSSMAGPVGYSSCIAPDPSAWAVPSSAAPAAAALTAVG